MYNCVNFDFGNRWSEIVPFLQTNEVENLLKLTHYEIAKYSRYGCYGGVEGYKKDRAPGFKLTRCDAWMTMIDNMREIAIENEDPRIPKELLIKHQKIENKYKDDDEDTEDFDYNQKILAEI